MPKAKGFDWDKAGPSHVALRQLKLVKSEREFPDTYSGQAWRAAYRVWKQYRERPADLDAIGPYDDIPVIHGMDLTGFMVGWAVNAVRQMLGRKPGVNGAIVGVGEPSPVVPASGSADADLRRALGQTPKGAR